MVSMREFKATEAKARFSELLRMVEHGETIAITRQGKVVAHLVPAWAQDRAHREEAVKQFWRRRAGWRRVDYSTEDILAARHEGHSTCHCQSPTYEPLPTMAGSIYMIGGSNRHGRLLRK